MVIFSRGFSEDLLCHYVEKNLRSTLLLFPVEKKMSRFHKLENSETLETLQQIPH